MRVRDTLDREVLEALARLAREELAQEEATRKAARAQERFAELRATRKGRKATYRNAKREKARAEAQEAAHIKCLETWKPHKTWAHRICPGAVRFTQDRPPGVVIAKPPKRVKPKRSACWETLAVHLSPIEGGEYMHERLDRVSPHRPDHRNMPRANRSKYELSYNERVTVK